MVQIRIMSLCLSLKVNHLLFLMTTYTVCSSLPCLFLLAAIIFVNSQTLKITLKDCDFNKEAAVGLLQAVGDRRLSLTIKYEYMYVILY